MFGNQIKKLFIFASLISCKLFCLRINIKNSTQCFITRWNTSKLVENTPLRVVFLSLFSVFHLVMNRNIASHADSRNWDDGMKTMSRGFSGGKQVILKISQYKKSRPSLFILDKRKWRTYYLEDANGKLWVKVFIVTLFASCSDRRFPFSV